MSVYITGAAMHKMIHKAVGEPNYESMMSHYMYERHLPTFWQFGPLHHVEQLGGWGDLGPPPLYMLHGPPSPLPSTDPNIAIHHPRFGSLMKDACDRVDNAESVIFGSQDSPRYGVPPRDFPSPAEFL